MWVSSWSLYNPVCASIALYRAVEGKEGVGKPLTPKANKAMKSGNGSFKHVPAPLARRSAGHGRKALRKSHLPSAPFTDQESSRHRPGGAGMVDLVLLRVPRRQQGQSSFSLGMLLQEREERGCQEGAGGPGTSGEQPGPAALPASSDRWVCTRPGSAVQVAIRQKALK